MDKDCNPCESAESLAVIPDIYRALLSGQREDRKAVRKKSAKPHIDASQPVQSARKQGAIKSPGAEAPPLDVSAITAAAQKAVHKGSIETAASQVAAKATRTAPAPTASADRDASGRFVSKSAQSSQERREDKRHKGLLAAITGKSDSKERSSLFSAIGENADAGASIGGVYGGAAMEIYRATSGIRESITAIRSKDNDAGKQKSSPLSGLTGRAKLFRRRELQADVSAIKTYGELQDLGKLSRSESKAEAKRHKETMDMLGGIIKAVGGNFGGLARLFGRGGGLFGGGTGKGGKGRGGKNGNVVVPGGRQRESKSPQKKRGLFNRMFGWLGGSGKESGNVKQDGLLGRIANLGKKAGGFVGGLGKSIGGIRGLGAVSGILASLGFLNTEMDESLTREEKNRTHGENVGRASVGLGGAAIGGLIGSFLGPLGTIAGGIIGGWAADFFAGDVLSEIGGEIADWIGEASLSELPNRIIDKFGEWTAQLMETDIGKYITGQWDALTGGIMGMWNNAVIQFQNAWGKLSNWVDSNVTGPISDFLGSVRDKIKSLTGIDVGELANKAASAVSSAVTQGASAAVNLASSAVSGAKEMASQMLGTADNSVSGLIHKGESKIRGYNDYNRGSDRRAASNKQNLDLSTMTIRQIMEQQSLPIGSADRLFAVGKYQMIPTTMSDTVKSLGISKNEKFTPELQEKMFVEYLATSKKGRGGLEKYIKGKGSDVETANLDVAKEWASVAYTGNSGYHDGVGNNKAHINAADMRKAIESAKVKYQELIARGMSDSQAYGIALGAYTDTTERSILDSMKLAAGRMTGTDSDLPSDVLSMRVKASDGSTRTLADLGVSTYGELHGRGGQAFAGGHNDPATAYTTAMIQKGLGNNFDRLTAQNDLYHLQNSPGSAHTKGNKTDFTVKGISSSEAGKRVNTLLNQYGLVSGKDYSLLDEYKDPSKKATGGHFDFRLNDTGKAKMAAFMEAGEAPAMMAQKPSDSGYAPHIDRPSARAFELMSRPDQEHMLSEDDYALAKSAVMWTARNAPDSEKAGIAEKYGVFLNDKERASLSAVTAAQSAQIATPSVAVQKTVSPIQYSPSTEMQQSPATAPRNLHPLEQFKRDAVPTQQIDTRQIVKAIQDGVAKTMTQQQKSDAQNGLDYAKSAGFASHIPTDFDDQYWLRITYPGMNGII